MSDALNSEVQKQRQRLTDTLGEKLSSLAFELSSKMDSRESVELILLNSCPDLKECKYIYVLDAEGRQITSNITREGVDEDQLGRDRSMRPYMAGMFGKTNFRLSEAYISRRKRRPSITAVQKIRDGAGKRLGFLGIDYDLRELIQTGGVYTQDNAWRQIKGDPSIRNNLFYQSRAQSSMDDHLDDVLALMEELMREQGIFHSELHFASSRANVWHIDDPYDYRILTIDELTAPDTCLAFPRSQYPERAVVPQEHIMQVFKQFVALRFADETIYLRAGSLNIINGKVGLNFSCDGSHFIHYEEFLGKGLEFWFGV